MMLICLCHFILLFSQLVLAILLDLLDSIFVSPFCLLQVPLNFEHVFSELFNAYAFLQKFFGQLADLFLHKGSVLFTESDDAVGPRLLELLLCLGLLHFIILFNLSLKNFVPKNVILRH